MESGKILESDYLDLIYDNRNKNYGGYELRKHYNRRATKALSITCAVILLAIGGPVIMSKLNAKAPVLSNKSDEIPVIITDIHPPTPPEPPKPPKPPVDAAATPRTAETIKNPVPKIVRNNDVPPDQKPPDTKELENKLSGPVSSPGEDGDVIAMNKEPRKGPFGDGYDPRGEKEGKPPVPVINDEPVRSPDEMPEFPGGMKALAEYLKNNVRYPAIAREDNIEGRVVISFVVNAQGAIEGAKVSRAIGGGCDREALRVVNAMPKWKPGKQNGRNVKVFYTLPITFRLES